MLTKTQQKTGLCRIMGLNVRPWECQLSLIITGRKEKEKVEKKRGKKNPRTHKRERCNQQPSLLFFSHHHFLAAEAALRSYQSFALSKATSFGTQDVDVHYMRLQRATCWRQLGQVWMTSLQPSTQKGIRQQPRSHLPQVAKWNQNKFTD